MYCLNHLHIATTMLYKLVKDEINRARYQFLNQYIDYPQSHVEICTLLIQRAPCIQSPHTALANLSCTASQSSPTDGASTQCLVKCPKLAVQITKSLIPKNFHHLRSRLGLNARFEKSVNCSFEIRPLLCTPYAIVR